MLRFIVRRIAWTIPVILLVILMTFFMMKLVPDGPFRHERTVHPVVYAQLVRQFNLDKPWYLQYVYYVKDVFTFDLGASMRSRNRDVNDVIKEHYPVSLELGGFALLFAIVVGIPLGIVAGLRQKRLVVYGAMAIVNAGYALPSFLVATLLIYFFAVRWAAYTPFPTHGWAGWESWVLPAITLGFAPMAVLAQLVRGSMLETLQADYVRTAKAKGLRWRRVVGLHVFRNSLIPAVTVVGPVIGYLIAGSFIVETIFGIPGIGRYFIIAVGSHDYTVVMGITVLLSLMIIIANLIVDILYGYLDPRTRDIRT